MRRVRIRRIIMIGDGLFSGEELGVGEGTEAGTGAGSGGRVVVVMV